MRDFEMGDGVATIFVVFGWLGVVAGAVIIFGAMDQRGGLVAALAVGLPVLIGGAVTVLTGTLVRAVIRQVNLTHDVIAELRKRPASEPVNENRPHAPASRATPPVVRHSAKRRETVFKDVVIYAVDGEYEAGGQRFPTVQDATLAIEDGKVR